MDLDASDSQMEETECTPTSLDYTYPPQASDGIRLMEGDLDTLEEEQYVNDNIINFYLRYLIEDRHLHNSVYAFNSFFYSSLAGSTSTSIHYERVQSWTKKVDLFAKECLIVPIIQNYHWRLAVIGHPRLLFAPDGVLKPYIVFFDSFIQGPDPTATWTLQEYLKREWEARYSENLSISLLDLQVQHPMQSNECDCGLFILGFAERYIEERMLFHEAAIKEEAVDRQDWFTPQEATAKRQFLKWLIRGLADGRDMTELLQSREVYFLVPTSILKSRRRKRPRLPLGEDFQYYQ